MSGLDRVVMLPEGIFLGCPRGVAFLAEDDIAEDVLHQAHADFPITAVIEEDGRVFLYVNVLATVESYRELAGEGGQNPSIPWLMEVLQDQGFVITLMNVYEGAFETFDDAARFVVAVFHGIPLEHVPDSMVQDAIEHRRGQRSEEPLFVGSPTREDLPNRSGSRCTCGLG